MKLQEGYSIFFSVAAFSLGDRMSVPYLFSEKGMLLDLDPEERPDSRTLLAYFPLTGDIWALKLKPEKTVCARSKLDSINKPVLPAP